jgi:hypothetical protein
MEPTKPGVDNRSPRPADTGSGRLQSGFQPVAKTQTIRST